MLNLHWKNATVCHEFILLRRAQKAGNCQMEAGKMSFAWRLVEQPKSSGCSQITLTRSSNLLPEIT